MWCDSTALWNRMTLKWRPLLSHRKHLETIPTSPHCPLWMCCLVQPTASSRITSTSRVVPEAERLGGGAEARFVSLDVRARCACRQRQSPLKYMQSAKQSASWGECLQPHFLCLYPSRRHIFRCLKVFQHLPTFSDTFWAIRLSVALYSPFYSHYHVNSASAAFQAARGGKNTGFIIFLVVI